MPTNSRKMKTSEAYKRTVTMFIFPTSTKGRGSKDLRYVISSKTAGLFQPRLLSDVFFPTHVELQKNTYLCLVEGPLGVDKSVYSSV